MEKAWREKGLKGFLVCKYAFKVRNISFLPCYLYELFEQRLPNQPPLPVRSQVSQVTAPPSDNAEASEPASDND